MSSARSHEAAQQLAATERQAPGPYLFLGYSDLGAQRVISRADPLAAPKQTTLLDVYREFRRVKPSGRFSIWTGFSIDDATGRPREFVALATGGKGARAAHRRLSVPTAAIGCQLTTRSAAGQRPAAEAADARRLRPRRFGFPQLSAPLRPPFVLRSRVRPKRFPGRFPAQNAGDFTGQLPAVSSADCPRACRGRHGRFRGRRPRRSRSALFGNIRPLSGHFRARSGRGRSIGRMDPNKPERRSGSFGFVRCLASSLRHIASRKIMEDSRMTMNVGGGRLSPAGFRHANRCAQRKGFCVVR